MGTSVKKIVHPCGWIVFTASLIVSLILTACNQPTVSKVPYYTDASFTPQWEMPAGKKDHHINAFSFSDQYGNSFGSKDVAGKIYLANFFFTSCKGICPKMLVNMQKVYQHFNKTKEVFFLSHSVTPEMDSTSRLKAYADDHGITGTQWHLLTGNVNDIYRMARQNYFVEEAEGLSKDATEFLHTENIVLIDQNGRLRGLYNGTMASEVPRIIDDINALLQER